jgi:hypothetical protein
VGLVAHDHVPAAVRGGELGLNVLVARELVEARDYQVVLQKPVARARGLELVGREDLEGELEAAVKLVLPLFGQAPRTDHEAAVEVAAHDQFFDEEPGDDGLPGLPFQGVVGQQEPKGPPGQHRLIHRGDLVRQRVYERGMDREHRVEQVHPDRGTPRTDRNTMPLHRLGFKSVRSPSPPYSDRSGQTSTHAPHKMVDSSAGLLNRSE